MPDEKQLASHQSENSHNEDIDHAGEALGQNHKISINQKIALVFLVFFSIGIFFMWGRQMRSTIMQLNSEGDDSEVISEESADGDCTSGNCDMQKQIELQTKDTDGDGLSDWDELNYYHTSPYLEDSDSDGFSDKIEIESNNDPNCPSGTDCYGGGGAEMEEDAEGADAQPDTGMLQMPDVQMGDIYQSDLSAADVANLKTILEQNKNPEFIRQLLLQAGADQATVDGFSDEELMQAFEETMDNL